jgi:hypothetical protein
MHITPDDMKAIAQVLNTEQVKALTMPVAKEVGEFLSGLGDMARVHSTEYVRQVVGRWMNYRDNRPLTDAEVKRVMPLLPTVSMQSEDEFTDKWAALLESAADGSNPYAASHAHTLSQLTPLEARVLSYLYKEVLAPSDLLHPDDPPLLRFMTCYKSSDQSLCMSFGQLESQTYSVILFNYISNNQIVLLRTNLRRLFLIDHEDHKLPRKWIDVHGNVTVNKDVAIPVSSPIETLSPYGRAFMEAVIR